MTRNPVITYLLGTALGVLGGIIGTSVANHGRDVTAHIRGIKAGQCSVMRWDIQTKSLRPDAERATRSVYADICKNEEPLS